MTAVTRNAKVAIIGGGPTGIGVARELVAGGVEVDLYEAESDFGGVWNADAACGRAYDSLHLISPKFNTQAPDFPMPEDYPPYPNHRLMLRYIRDFARASGLYERTRFEALGSGPETLAQLAEGGIRFHSVLKNARRPLVIVGQGALARTDGAAVLALAAKIAADAGAVTEEWNGFAVLHTAAARVGGLDLGFVPGEGAMDVAAMLSGGLDVLFLLGADEIDTTRIGDAFTVYIGSHGDAGAHRADVILPGATYTEKSGTYVNTEGRVQQTSRAGFAPGEAREDWAILRALSDVLGKRLPFDSLGQLRAKLYEEFPHFAGIDGIVPGNAADVAALAGAGAGALAKAAFSSTVVDFYLTNPIARASAVMAECSALAKGGVTQAAE